MPKTVMLANDNPKLVHELQAHGFRVVDNNDRSRPGMTADAYLYTSYRPDMNDGLTCHPVHADRSIGNYHYTTDDHPATIMLNITGLNAGQVVDTLRQQLARKPQL
ncbi:hypothetical protein SCACP_39900 [Sporomusa carbonis]|uniref:hypothetical protein n=1 Tax=Sporomusa carbonis TaxID=3076075 RepID=UPI003A774C96